jgi:uncharacterized protein YjiS (DUF1127 family)
MTSLHVRGWMTSADHGARKARNRRWGMLAKPPTRVFIAIRDWFVRMQRRRNLVRLAELDDHLLKDIGVSRQEASREAAKWFWQR